MNAVAIGNTATNLIRNVVAVCQVVALVTVTSPEGERIRITFISSYQIHSHQARSILHLEVMLVISLTVPKVLDMDSILIRIIILTDGSGRSLEVIDCAFCFGAGTRSCFGSRFHIAPAWPSAQLSLCRLIFSYRLYHSKQVRSSKYP